MSATGRGETRVIEPSRGQRALARRAAESRATIPYAEMTIEVALDPDLEPVDVTGGLLAALAGALRDVPEANASYSDGAFALHSRVNVALVVETDDGLALPTLFDADTRPPDDLARAATELAARGRSGELTAPEQSGATFSLWDLSATAVRTVSPLIVPPHAGALGAGGVQPTRFARDAAIVPTHTMCLTLASDHRILYGRRAAEFLEAVRSRLEGT